MRGRKQSAVGPQRDPAGEVSDSAVPIDRFWCCGGAVEPLVAASRMRGRKESAAGQRRDPAGEVSISVATSDRSWCCEELRILSWPPPWLAISRATSSPTFIRTMTQAPLPIVVPPLAADRAVGGGDVLAIVPNRLEALDGGSFLQVPIQSFVIPPKPALWAKGRGDVLAISPETASFAITPILTTENIRI